MKTSFLLFLLSIFSETGSAQYAIPSWTVDGGGGTSTGGRYAISGAIGQPDAGVLNGGPYNLIGGYWTFPPAQPPSPPLLGVELQGDAVRVFWPLPATGFVLDHTAQLGADIQWTPVPFPYQTNATHIFITVPSPSASGFYRLSRP